MTNEEAISILNVIVHMLEPQYDTDRIEKAVEMAIKALEQEPYICDSCKNKDKEWDTEPCDGCCGNHSGYEPTDKNGNYIYPSDIVMDDPNTVVGCIPTMIYPQVEGITPTVVKAEQEPTEKITNDVWKDFKKRKAMIEQEPTSVKHDTFPVKLRINKVSKHISNIDLDELEQEPTIEAYSQVCKERDIAIEQLHELGYELGQKIEPCDDLISRQAVDTLVDELARAISDERCCMSRGRSTATIMQDILDLPSVRPQEPKWIPVSERLPESRGMYIVTRKIYDCPDTAPIIMSDESWFDGTNTWHNDNRINHDRKYLTDVIAWMPLPKPYEPQERSEIHCTCTDAEIAKSFIEDVEAVKELLPQAESEDKE